MILLTINMNMFNFVIDDSFNSYIESVNPDLTFIQECRYNRINEKSVCYAGNYDEKMKIDSRIHLSVAFSKVKESTNKRSIEPCIRYDYTCVFIEYKNQNITGIHLPLPKDESNKDYNSLLKKIETSESQIICGDFNATENNANYNFIEKLLRNDYCDLWSKGLNEGKAYYIDYAGKEIKANSKKHKKLRTFVGNTHIDYIFAKRDIINLNKIIIDFRTLAFTDHCGIIADFEIQKNNNILSVFRNKYMFMIKFLL